jgi:hypothetical protein
MDDARLGLVQWIETKDILPLHFVGDLGKGVVQIGFLSCEETATCNIGKLLKKSSCI